MLGRSITRVAVRPFVAAALPLQRRALSATALRFGKAPAMGDIDASPSSVEQFNNRQAEFRKRLHDEAKKREAEAFEKIKAQSKPLVTGAVQGLGSLSTAIGLNPEAETPHKAGRLSNFIYGSKEGREMDAHLEASFSAVLARGKYVHSIVFHTVKPSVVDEYVSLIGQWYPKIAANPDLKLHLVGSWKTEVGDCDTFVHIWEYPRYQGYHEAVHAISDHPEYSQVESHINKLLERKSTSLMQEFSFWPTSPPRHLGGVFELRSYTLHPGNLLEWETHWRRGLQARREVMEGVGAWFVQIGDLNTVHHLWQFANLEERKIRREKSWQIEGWSETVHKTVPLIERMVSRILIPLPFSPVK